MNKTGQCMYKLYEVKARFSIFSTGEDGNAGDKAKRR